MLALRSCHSWSYYTWFSIMARCHLSARIPRSSPSPEAYWTLASFQSECLVKEKGQAWWRSCTAHPQSGSLFRTLTNSFGFPDLDHHPVSKSTCQTFYINPCGVHLSFQNRPDHGHQAPPKKWASLSTWCSSFSTALLGPFIPPDSVLLPSLLLTWLCLLPVPVLLFQRWACSTCCPEGTTYPRWLGPTALILQPSFTDAHCSGLVLMGSTSSSRAT